jgi:hypothetical protein
MSSTSTKEGMQIDESEEHSWNASIPIFESFEPVSNVTVERARHPVKHIQPSSSTEEGMQSDESAEHA